VSVATAAAVAAAAHPIPTQANLPQQGALPLNRQHQVLHERVAILLNLVGETQRQISNPVPNQEGAFTLSMPMVI